MPFLSEKSDAMHWLMLTWWNTAPSREVESKVLIKDSIHFHLFGVLRVNWFSLLLHTLFISLPVPICSHYLLASDAATISFHSRRQIRVKPKAELFCATIDKWKRSSGNKWHTHSLGLSVSDIISSSFPFLAPQSPPPPILTLFPDTLSPFSPASDSSLSFLGSRASIKQWFCMTEQSSAQLLLLPNTHIHSHRRAL